MSARWRVESPQRFAWHVWEGDYVVFVPHSGDTHALSPNASALLEAMLQCPGVSRSTGEWLGEIMAEPEGEQGEHKTSVPVFSEAELRGCNELLEGLRHIGVVTQSRP